MEALALEAFRKHVGDHGEKAVSNIGHQQADEPAGAAAHDACRRVCDIAEGLCGNAHPLLGFAANTRMIGNGTPDSRWRQTELLGNVLDCDHGTEWA